MLVIHILIQDRDFKLFFMKLLMRKAIAYRQRTEQSRNVTFSKEAKHKSHNYYLNRINMIVEYLIGIHSNSSVILSFLM